MSVTMCLFFVVHDPLPEEDLQRLRATLRTELEPSGLLCENMAGLTDEVRRESFGVFKEGIAVYECPTLFKFYSTPTNGNDPYDFDSRTAWAWFQRWRRLIEKLLPGAQCMYAADIGSEMYPFPDDVVDPRCLWVVGNYIREESPHCVWEMMGVFSTRDLALAACTSETHFVAPQLLDVREPDKSEMWDGTFYPLAYRMT